MNKIVTIKEIAKLAGVSSATVSKVINGKDEHISQATREKVLELVEREGYIPNAIAKSLKLKKTKTIGIIVPDVMNLFFSELARRVEDAAERYGYSVILCNSDNDEKKEERYLTVLQEKMVDGIILTSAEKSKKDTLKKINTPLVLLDREIDSEENVGKIFIDNEKGLYDATCYLIEKGCKNIGFISSINRNKLSADRKKGYEKALKEHGIKVLEKNIYLGAYDVETGYKGAIEILEDESIDGICCGNDLIAMGAIRAAKEKNISIPGKIRIIGFDDIQISKYLDPPLTTMKQPIYEMGEGAIKILINIIENNSLGDTRVLETKLIERSSS